MLLGTLLQMLLLLGLPGVRPVLPLLLLELRLGIPFQLIIGIMLSLFLLVLVLIGLLGMLL